MNEFLSHYREIVSDPAHMAAEITFMLLIDVLFLGVLWPLVKHAIKREHRKIDAEHGVNHNDPSGMWGDLFPRFPEERNEDGSWTDVDHPTPYVPTHKI